MKYCKFTLLLSKKLLYSFIITFFTLSLVVPALAFPEDNPSSLLSGRIILDNNNKDIWYIYPGDYHRYYLGTPGDIHKVMSNLSLGISNEDFSKIASSTPPRLEGLILIKPEDFGKAYYVNPTDNSIIYLADSVGALELMRQIAIVIDDKDLQTIPVGKIVLDASGRVVSREWQYLGWWGEVNKNYVPVMEEPRSDSKKLGLLYVTNKVKVLDIKKNAGNIWYQIDGGQYPGTYIDSRFIDVIAQPNPSDELNIPDTVEAEEYWVDVNISKKVLTLYKYDQVVMATYIAVGVKETPTILGTYNVWFKTKKIRMKGAPPIATHEYDLPDVPWTMFYKGSYSLHGTYWHDDFGAQRSAGCTNLTQGDAKFIFYLTSPEIGEANAIHSTIDNPGLVVYNHY